MKYEELMEIAQIVDKIKMTNIYQAYERSYRSLLIDQRALKLLAEYHQIQGTYATSVVNSGFDAESIAKMKQQLLAKKFEINTNVVLDNYFVMSRTIEFFINDLNYEINQMLGKKQKKQCGTQRKAK